MKIKWGDKKANIETLRRSVEFVHPATDIIVLPEMFSTGFIVSDKEEIRKLAERNTGETIDILKEISSAKGMAIAGSFIADTGGQLFNRAFFVEPDGEVIFADKRHLFSMADEHKIFSNGDTRLQVRFRGWNISMVVCYDIRFPAWCRNRENQYDLLLAVANWPEVRVDAWNQLLRARAIENLAYVGGVNCAGVDNSGISYDGSSPLFDFIGKEISSCIPSEPFRYGTLSYEKLQRFRDKFPAWKDADKFDLETEID